MRINYGLKPGDRLTIMEAFIDPEHPGNQASGRRTRECMVLREYPEFILADFGAYRESINKACIYCKEVLIWKGWKNK